MTKEEFLAWLDHPVTHRFMDYVEEKREALKEVWATGGFTGATFEETHTRNVAATGTSSAYEEILELEYDDLRKEDDESDDDK